MTHEENVENFANASQKKNCEFQHSVAEKIKHANVVDLSLKKIANFSSLSQEKKKL